MYTSLNGFGRWRRGTLALAFLLALGIGAVQTAIAQPASDELEVMQLINSERAALGRSALGTDVRLFEAARLHAVWMASVDTLSHTGSGGSSPGSRVTAAGYVWTHVGETLGAGQETPEEIVLGRPCDSWCTSSCSSGRCDGWKQSSGHWTVLMSSSYRDIGVSHISDASPNPFADWWGVSVANSSMPATPVGDETTVPPTQTPQLTSTRTPTLTATASPTRTATQTWTPTSTAVSSATPTATRTASATRTATAVPTATRTPSATAVPSETATSLPTDTETPVPATATSTHTPSPPSPSQTPTVTQMPTATQTSLPTQPPTDNPTPTQVSGEPGSTLIGRVRLQALGSWEGTDILFDGVRVATTSADGWLAILSVVPGDHVLEARQAGYLTSLRTIYVEPGRVTNAGETLLMAGDAFADQRIDMLDVLTVNSAMDLCRGEPGYERRIDANNSGCVDSTDLAITYETFGRSGPIRWAPIPVD